MDAVLNGRYIFHGGVLNPGLLLMQLDVLATRPFYTANKMTRLIIYDSPASILEYLLVPYKYMCCGSGSSRILIILSDLAEKTT